MSDADTPQKEAPEAPRFEDTMRRLETVVARLEQGDQSLEEALQDFEQGMSLARAASEVLDAAEARVDELLEERDGSTREVPLSDPPDSGW
ncbi:MAG: exodeoxyribonuclease VII small subunit [Myxococcota bacterium]